ncbi:polyphosphate polymerase domain-containing protein [Paenibacillus sp. YYML68]|uniref:polyphosphate polymerase domain-containing protein n=1 Tax=Paenibacillus sp. YYML68 TaxID=2909250 RepID=UPI0024916E71|nr:polyphosphate polymerase domain-containing protein [Paenibacillus sp. YYML68]
MKYDGKKLRHELKFYINPRELVSLRQRVQQLLPLDRYSVSPEGYHIRSLYMDDYGEGALYDKINGVFSRRKYRIRIYNKSDKIIKLERKSKFNEYVAKESATLTREQVDRLLEGDVSWASSAPRGLLQDFYLDVKHGAMKPSVIVDYVREAYIDELSDTRITFDKQLASGFHHVDLFDAELPTWPAVDDNRYILEVKYNAFLPHSIRALVQMETHQRSTISKYVLCKERQKVYYKA